MKIEELYKDIEEIKDKIWNNNKPLLKEEYLKYTPKQVISLLEMITRDIGKILDKLRFETRIEFEVKQRQKEKAKAIKDLFK